MEIWKTVPEDTRYAVSSEGRVRHGANILRGEIGSDRRIRVTISGRRKSVHVLVAELFHGPRPTGAECLHGDGDPQNNSARNLRWGTRSENQIDSVNHGSHYQASKTHCPRGHALAAGNLVRRKLPYRQCLTCERERDRRRSRTLEKSRGR